MKHRARNLAAALVGVGLLWSGCTVEADPSILPTQCTDCDPPPFRAGALLDTGDLEDDTPVDECAEVNVTFAQQLPTVVLLIDQSGSMDQQFDGMQRLDAVYEALMNLETGVVNALADDVRFGLSLYTSYNGGPTCPVLTEVEPEVGNHAAIDAVLADAEPEDDTPTGEAILATAETLAAMDAPGDKLILLATDGEPDTCEVPDPQHGQEEAVLSAEAAHAMGVDVVVLAVGNELSMAHQQEMADAGAGVEGAPVYRPATRAELVDDFETIIHGVRSCVLDLNGEVDEQYAHEGTVTLNGIELPYGDPDGWKLTSPSQIELVGAACQELMEGDDTVEGSFPCHAFLQPPR
jgi:hypothetical protein